MTPIPRPRAPLSGMKGKEANATRPRWRAFTRGAPAALNFELAIPKNGGMTTRKRLVLVGTCLVLFAGLLAAVFFALNRAVPVATEYTAGTLTLTSRSDSAWTARVAAGDWVETVDLGARGTAQMAIPRAAGEKPMVIELYRPNATAPGWTIEYGTQFNVDASGFEAGAGYRVEASLAELLRLTGR